MPLEQTDPLFPDTDKARELFMQRYATPISNSYFKASTSDEIVKATKTAIDLIRADNNKMYDKLHMQQEKDTTTMPPSESYARAYCRIVDMLQTIGFCEGTSDPETVVAIVQALITNDTNDPRSTLYDTFTLVQKIHDDITISNVFTHFPIATLNERVRFLDVQVSFQLASQNAQSNTNHYLFHIRKLGVEPSSVLYTYQRNHRSIGP